MKLKLFAAAAAAVLLAGCSSEQDNITDSDIRIHASDNAAEAAETVSVTPSEPFSEYNFELKGTKENYMIIVRRSEHEDEISVTIENNRYESKDFIITAPSGYNTAFPFEQRYASHAVNVITNDIDDTEIPDLMQFTFYASEETAENEAYSVSRMYTVDDKGELREIKVIDINENGEEYVADYIDRTQLYHSEPHKFIYEISVDDKGIYDENGVLRPVEDRVRIRTMTYDYENSELIMGYEEVSEENPLYFGYAYWAAANSAAQYFTMSTLNVSDYENYAEIFDDNASGASEYYFRIDDSRFSDTNDLMEYLETIFTEATAQRIFSEAPQKYRDIDGKLYGIVGDGGYDFTLGTLTFSGMEISEDRMLFRSRQEKFDENGIFTGYTDGGDFVISRQSDGYWKVVQYRYPYSLN